MNKPVIILGAGGHASVLIEILKLQKRDILGVVALEDCSVKNYPEIPYLGLDDIILKNYRPEEINLVNGIGAVSVERNHFRRKQYSFFKDHEYCFETLIHPFSYVASTVFLAEGVQVMAGSVIQPNCLIGENSIINTGVRIDHDCVISNHVHIAPGATLSGTVKVGECSHIGVGANIIQNITIENDTLVRSGQTVKD